MQAKSLAPYWRPGGETKPRTPKRCYLKKFGPHLQREKTGSPDRIATPAQKVPVMSQSCRRACPAVTRTAADLSAESLGGGARGLPTTSPSSVATAAMQMMQRPWGVGRIRAAPRPNTCTLWEIVTGPACFPGRRRRAPSEGQASTAAWSESPGATSRKKRPDAGSCTRPQAGETRTAFLHRLVRTAARAVRQRHASAAASLRGGRRGGGVDEVSGAYSDQARS